MHKRDTRLLSTAVKEKEITPDRVKNENLKYYQVKYTCVYGGRPGYKPRGDGSRKTKTFQCGCPFFILLRLSDDGDHLVVTKINKCHNDHGSEDDYNYLPKVRKLTDEQREYSSNLIAIGANRKKLQQEISKSTGKRVTMKDLSNIGDKQKKNQHGTTNDLSKCVDDLKTKHNCSVDISVDVEDKF